MMRHFAIMLIILSLCSSLPAQNVFNVGEKLEYNVSYNWQFIWIKAANVSFEVSDTIISNHAYVSFNSYGSSLKRYDWIFKVRDSYRSRASMDNLKPLWYHRKNYEGGFEVDYEYQFDDAARKIYCRTQNSDRPLAYDTIPWTAGALELVTATYHTRNLNFSGMNVGDTVPVQVIIDRKPYNLFIRYLGKETIKNRDGHKYRCLKFSALLVSGTIFKGGEDLYVWVTEDGNKIPVQVEAKILVGSVKAWLSGYKNLKNPVDARVDE